MVDEVLNVKGLADLNAALNDLAVALARNVLRGAVRAGAEVIRKEAVTRAPVYAPPGAPDQRVDPGLIKRSIFSAHVPNQSDDTKTGIHCRRAQWQTRAACKGARARRRLASHEPRRVLRRLGGVWALVRAGSA
jgi:hypothetical protein